jgi:hypothetical protein
MIQRYFLILTAGHSGSAWLAKLLNSHFEAMCFHELEAITYTLGWPPQVRAYFEFGDEERLRNLLYLFSPSHRYGDSYQVLGALPGRGVDLSVRRTIKAVATYFPDVVAKTRFFILMRNPVSQIHSQTAGCVRMGQCVAAHEQMREFHRDCSKQVLATMEPQLAQSLLGEMKRGDVETEYFIHACLTNVQLIWAAQEAQAMVPYPSVLQLEHLIQNETALRDALWEVTGLKYDLPVNFADKVNVKSGGLPPWRLFQSWSPQRQHLFTQVFEPLEKTLENLGYDLSST